MKTLKILVFVGTEGLYHDHFGNGKYLADMLSKTEDIAAEVSRDYEILSKGLAAYDAVLFYTDIGRLAKAQEKGLMDYIRAGGGFFGLHTAAASFQDCPAYHAMLNASFKGHSDYMKFTVNILDHDDPITRGCGDFTVTDELYYLEHDPFKSRHLMQAYDPTRKETHVMAFKHAYGKGRVFYFALGHNMEEFKHPSFQETVRRGALWTAQKNN